MRGLSGDSAETQYALAYALERLGEIDEAKKAYNVVLIIEGRHAKARARPLALAIYSDPVELHRLVDETARECDLLTHRGPTWPR